MSQSSKKTTLEFRTGEKLVRNCTLYRGAVCPIKKLPFFFKYKHKTQISLLPQSLGIGLAPRKKRRARNACDGSLFGLRFAPKLVWNFRLPSTTNLVGISCTYAC